MYKSKLQEYCQSKAWNLPEYSSSKEGLDHCPQFKATVTVNGFSYTTPNVSRSSKEAQNTVAKLAYEHLTGSSSAGSLASPSPSPAIPTSSGVQLANTNLTQRAASSSGVNSKNRDDNKHKDMGHLYKHQLQIYAQRRSLALPVYTSEREGPPHACRFRTKVMLEGKTYETLEYFSTIKDSENAAAKVALTEVLPDGIEEEDPAFFKNLLQELALKEYSCLPVYTTTRTGASHMPIFVSTVVIKEESFTGQQAKTKKLAELNAAKTAFATLKERQQKQISEPYSTVSHMQDIPHCSSPKSLSTAMDNLPQKNIPNTIVESSEISIQDAQCKKGAYQKARKSEHEPEASSSTDQTTWANQSPDLVRAPDASPYSSYKKVKVYPWAPNMTILPGTVIMRQDDKWVAVAEDSIDDHA